MRCLPHRHNVTSTQSVVDRVFWQPMWQGPVCVARKDINNQKMRQLRLHCNLRPPDAEPVIFRFNWDARAKFEVHQSIRSSFLAPFTRPNLWHTFDERLLRGLKIAGSVKKRSAAFIMANSAFHPSGVGKWVPASAGKAKAVWFIPLADERGVCR